MCARGVIIVQISTISCARSCSFFGFISCYFYLSWEDDETVCFICGTSRMIAWLFKWLLLGVFSAFGVRFNICLFLFVVLTTAAAFSHCGICVACACGRVDR